MGRDQSGARGWCGASTVGVWVKLGIGIWIRVGVKV